MSVREYQDLKRFLVFKREVYRIEDLPPEIADNIQNSAMSPEHNHLNELME